MFTTLVVLTLLGGSQNYNGCVERCSADNSRCADRCGSNNRCAENCNRRTGPCMDTCSAPIQKAEAKEREANGKAPCGADMEKKTATPCSEKELKGQQEALKSSKVKLCKDADGEFVPCAGDKERTEATMKKYGIRLDCVDPNGVPMECPPKKK